MVKPRAASLHVGGGVADQVAGDAALGDVGPEPFGMGGDPVGHIAAVAPAGDTQAFPVDPGKTAQALVDKLKDVGKRAAVDRTGVILMHGAVAAAAPGVAVQNPVPSRGQALKLRGEAVGVKRMRTPVDIEDGRICFPFLPSGGGQDEAVHPALAVQRFKEKVLRLGKLTFRQNLFRRLNQQQVLFRLFQVDQQIGLRPAGQAFRDHHFSVLDAAQPVDDPLSRAERVSVLLPRHQAVQVALALPAGDKVNIPGLRVHLHLVQPVSAEGVIGKLHALVAAFVRPEDLHGLSPVHGKAEKVRGGIAQGRIGVRGQRPGDDGAPVRGEHRADGVGIGDDREFPGNLPERRVFRKDVHHVEVKPDALFLRAVLIARRDDGFPVRAPVVVHPVVLPKGQLAGGILPRVQQEELHVAVRPDEAGPVHLVMEVLDHDGLVGGGLLPFFRLLGGGKEDVPPVRAPDGIHGRPPDGGAGGNPSAVQLRHTDLAAFSREGGKEGHPGPVRGKAGAGFPPSARGQDADRAGGKGPYLHPVRLIGRPAHQAPARVPVPAVQALQLTAVLHRDFAFHPWSPPFLADSGQTS